MPGPFGMDGSHLISSLPQPVSKPSRSMSTSSVGSLGEPLTPGGSYPKAPGSERSERSSSREEDHQVIFHSLKTDSHCMNVLCDL